jgi:hypothetical protein
MTKILQFSLVLVLVFTSFIAYGNSSAVSNGFAISDKFFKFNKITKTGKCEGTIKYPNLYGGDTEVTEQINLSIKNFVESYDFCKADSMKFTTYKVWEGSRDYFSVKWVTRNSKQKTLMINSLNFAKADAKIISIEDVLNPLAKNFMPEFVKLSENHLAADTTWEQFLNKLEQGYIQFYVWNSKWYIVFNPHAGVNKLVVEKELPAYLLKSTS